MLLNNPIINEIKRLKPGQAIQYSRYELIDKVPGFHHNDAYFSPANRVLENIMGSAYEYYYEEKLDGDIVFYRLKKPLKNGRTYTSPDRR